MDDPRARPNRAWRDDASAAEVARPAGSTGGPGPRPTVSGDGPGHGPGPWGPMCGQRGFALLTVLLVLALLTGLTVVAHVSSRAESRIGGNDYAATRAFYAAEAGAEHLLAALRAQMSNGILTAAKVDAADNNPPGIPGFQLTEYSAQLVGGVTDEKITQGPFAGLWSRTQELVVTSSVQGDAGSRTTVELNAKALAIPVFQFAAFYNEDLEIFPGPTMDLAGRVHTNSDLYLGAGSGLQFWDVVTSSGNLHMHRKHDPSIDTDSDPVEVQKNDNSWADVDTDVHDFCGGGDPDPGCSGTDDQNWVDHSKSNWDNNIQTQSHGIQPLRLPVPEGTDPYELIEPCGGSVPPMEDIKYACNADVVITLTGGASPSDLSVADGGLGWDGDEVTWRPDQFYDDREQDDHQDPLPGSVVTWEEANRRSNRDVIELDVSRLELDDFDTSASGGGTIVYVQAEPAGVGLERQQYVVRVVNGGTLQAPLTIATHLPLYVQGDFNDHDPDWKPASLVSDNLTFLSNCWNDAQSNDAGNEESGADNACGTEVQAAILSGHTPTSGPLAAPAEEGGQFENFPRFLEDWGGGRTMTINGSFVSMWYDRFSDEPWQWCGCMTPTEDYYSPPTRDWSFDTRFEDPANLPPGTPVVGQILRIGFQRTY